MNEQRYKLSPVQWNSLASVEMRITELKKEIERLTEIRNMSLDLILDAHNIQLSNTKTLKGIDAETKELVTEDKMDNIQATPIPD
jgi:hypothetical protein